MKNTSLWLRGICIVWILLVAMSFHQAFGQTTYDIPILPKYQVLGVVYAPPGSASSVTYGSSEAVGSSNSIIKNSSDSNTVTASASVKAGFGLWSTTITTTTSDGWTSTLNTDNTITVQTTQGNSITTLGPISSALGVNHDNDVIYILLNPVLIDTVSVTDDGSGPKYTTMLNQTLINSCNLNNTSFVPTLYQTYSGCDPNQFPYPDIIGIPVWCLKNPYYPGQGCAQWLPYISRSWDHSYRGTASLNQHNAYPMDPTNTSGLTLQDLADILKADPFVLTDGQPDSANSCHSVYGPNLDPNASEVIPSTPQFNGAVTSVFVADGGSYASAPAVTFSAPGTTGGVTAQGSAVMVGSMVGAVLITNPGKGYQAAPTVSFDGITTNAIAVAYIPDQPTTCGTPGGGFNRFQPYGTIEYPVPGPNGLPSTYSSTFTQTNGSSTSISTSDTHTVGVGVDVTESLGLAIPDPGTPASLSFGGSLSAGYNHSSSMTSAQTSVNNRSTMNSAAYTITGPQLSDNYTGPATYNVYVDNIYGTYAFYSDLEPTVTLGSIGIAPTSSPGSPLPVLDGSSGGGTSARLSITLTNNSIYPLTMVGPAVTFNDPGFQIAQDGSDHCSNQYLLPHGQTSGAQTFTCTLNVVFTPVGLDAWNPVLNPSGMVNATVIAAGTENASSYQNILVTSHVPIFGLDTDTQGSTLIADGNPVTPDNPIPNIFRFSTSGGGALTQHFNFRNYYGAGVTINSFALGDSTDFSVVSDPAVTNPCTIGVPFAGSSAGNTCVVTLQFKPTSASITNDVGTFNSTFKVLGTVNTAGVISPPVVTLAMAGAVGFAIQPLSVSPAEVWVDLPLCIEGHCGSETTATVTATNNTNENMTVFTVLAAQTVLAPGGSQQFQIRPTGSGSHDTYLRITGETTPIGSSTVDNTYYATVTVHVIDPNNLDVVTFAPDASTQSQTVYAGQTAYYGLQIAPPSGGSYSGVVTFTATGLPVGAVASFSPATLAANAGAQTVLFSVQTPAAQADLIKPSLPGRMLTPILLSFLLMPLAVLKRQRARSSKLVRLLSLALIIAVSMASLIGVTGCSSTQSSSVTKTVTPQNYTIKITATMGKVAQSTTVNLTVN